MRADHIFRILARNSRLRLALLVLYLDFFGASSSTSSLFSCCLVCKEYVCKCVRDCGVIMGTSAARVDVPTSCLIGGNWLCCIRCARNMDACVCPNKPFMGEGYGIGEQCKLCDQWMEHCVCDVHRDVERIYPNVPRYEKFGARCNEALGICACVQDCGMIVGTSAGWTYPECTELTHEPHRGMHKCTNCIVCGCALVFDEVRGIYVPK